MQTSSQPTKPHNSRSLSLSLGLAQASRFATRKTLLSLTVASLLASFSSAVIAAEGDELTTAQINAQAVRGH